MHLVMMVNHHFVIGRSFLTELSNILNNTANDTIVELLQRYNADQLQIAEEELWVVEAPIMPEPEPEPGTHFIISHYKDDFFCGGGGGGGGGGGVEPEPGTHFIILHYKDDWGGGGEIAMTPNVYIHKICSAITFYPLAAVMKMQIHLKRRV